MSYGMQILNSSGGITLDISDRSARLVNTQTVTMPSSGVSTNFTIPSVCTSSNSFCILDNGAGATITSAGVAQIIGSNYITGTTVLRTYRYK